MSVTSWSVNGRQVTATHSWWTGVSDVYVDDSLVVHRPSPFLWVDYGFARRFDVDGTPCVLKVVCVGFWYRKDLLVGEEAEGVSDADKLRAGFPHSLWTLVVFALLIIVALDLIMRFA